MRESRQTKSKQKPGYCNLNLRSLTLCHQSFRSPPFQLNASITAANSLGPQPFFFILPLTDSLESESDLKRAGTQTLSTQEPNISSHTPYVTL